MTIRYMIKCTSSILLVTAILLSMYSCKKTWLDVKTDKNLSVPSNLNDFELILDNTDINSSNVSIGQIASDDYYINEASWKASLFNIERNSYTWTKTLANNAVVDWLRSYQNVFYANVVLDGLKKLTVSGDRDINRFNSIMGNALFIRAKAFYDLAQVYAPPYDSSSAKTDLGIPLRLEADINIATVRSTVQETYNRIITDLNDANKRLPAVPVYKTRGSRGAAFAMLSRVYLLSGDYSKAKAYADSSLSINSNKLSYSTLSTTTNYGALIFNSEVIYHCSSIAYSVINSRALLDSNFRNTYDSNDLRRVVYFKQNADKTYKFKGSYDNSTTARFFMGIASDEMFLTRAESYARLGNKDLAMNDLNELLKSRWKTGKFVPLVASDVNAALAIILAERRKSLIFRGVRWPDLRRLNKDERFKTTLQRTIGGQTYVLEPNSPRYTFPIPDDIIQMTGIPQNQ